MSTQEIRDKKGNLIGTINDTSGSGSEDLDPLQKWGLIIAAVIGAVIGSIVGFGYGGLGGAIVGIIIGAVACPFAAAVFVEEWLPVLIIGGVIYGFIWIIVHFWGVGKP